MRIVPSSKIPETQSCGEVGTHRLSPKLNLNQPRYNARSDRDLVENFEFDRSRGKVFPPMACGWSGAGMVLTVVVHGTIGSEKSFHRRSRLFVGDMRQKLSVNWTGQTPAPVDIGAK